MVQQEWQCVMVCWGDKYTVADINHLVSNIIKTSSIIPHFYLITDQPRLKMDKTLHKAIHCLAFPDFFRNPQFKNIGCQAKLAMFEQGLLRDDLWAVYIDLDTVVLGDLSQAVHWAKSDRSIVMLRSVGSFSALGRFIWRITKTKKYPRGNSSLVVFHPAHCGYIAHRFQVLFQQKNDLHLKSMIADERFISWVAQPYISAFPKHFAIKFATEFMMYWRWLTLLKTSLFWVEKRRQNLTVVTLAGVVAKPSSLLELKDGAVISDNKSRKLIWSHKGIGAMKRMLIDYYKNS